MTREMSARSEGATTLPLVETSGVRPLLLNVGGGRIRLGGLIRPYNPLSTKSESVVIIHVASCQQIDMTQAVSQWIRQLAFSWYMYSYLSALQPPVEFNTEPISS